jgi:hypothetical protein
MREHSSHRVSRWLCWVATAAMSYCVSFFVVMAIVCRAGIDLSDSQRHSINAVYRPVYKVLPSPVISKGLTVFAGLSEIEAFFWFNLPQEDPHRTR